MILLSTRLGAARSVGATLLVMGLVAALAGPARAQVDVTLTIKEPPKEAEKGAAKNPPPTFRAAIVGAVPGLAAEQFILRQEDVDTPISVAAEKVQTYTESDDKMALVVLIQGDERWMGNETYRDEEDPDRQEGAYTGIGPALDALGKAGPPGSRATLLVYTAGKGEVKQPMGDATQLGAASLGGQKDYEGKIGIPLLVGLDEAITVFDQHAGYRKILVVIGDGTGQEEDISAGLKERVDKLKQRKVEAFSIHYESIPSASPVGQQNMNRLGYTESKHASSRDNFSAFADGFVEAIGARFYATFPGCKDATQAQCFNLDGQLHEFVVKAGEQESDVIEVQTFIWNAPKPKEESSLWWLWLLLGLLVIGIVVVVLVVRARGQEAPPPPMPVMEMPPAPMGGPAKTIMINAAGDAGGGLPLVGWIVPLVGPNQYQTFKLLQGVTKIGTAPDCNILIQDSFMSSLHAEIVCSPTGFLLKDGGSTNGTYVNDRRVSSHDLVDNDLFTMGKTSFKFKSIN